MASKMNTSEKEDQVSEENILELIPKLRNLLLEQHNLDIPERSNDFLARCLRLKDGNLENAVKLVLVFPKMCTELKTWNICITPSFYKQSWYDLFAFYPLAVRDSENRRIIIIQIEKWDTNLLNCDEVLQAGGLLLQYAAAQSLEDQRDGFVVVWDYTGFSRNHVFAFKHRSLLTMARLAANGAAGRVKGCHCFNHPKPISVIYSALKPFLKRKLTKRVHFHDNVSSIVAKLGVDTKFLPKILGGDLEPEECIDKKFMQEFLNTDEYFEDMYKNGFPTR